MARSRRAYKKTASTVRVGLLPKRIKLNAKTATKSYVEAGYLLNPNLISGRNRSSEVVQSASLQVPGAMQIDEQFGSDDENDELRSALGKKRKDGQVAKKKRLTKMQRVYVAKLISKHGTNYKAMAKDMTLNQMQHSESRLRRLCASFQAFEKLSDFEL